MVLGDVLRSIVDGPLPVNVRTELVLMKTKFKFLAIIVPLPVLHVPRMDGNDMRMYAPFF